MITRSAKKKENIKLCQFKKIFYKVSFGPFWWQNTKHRIVIKMPIVQQQYQRYYGTCILLMVEWKQRYNIRPKCGFIIRLWKNLATENSLYICGDYLHLTKVRMWIAISRRHSRAIYFFGNKQSQISRWGFYFVTRMTNLTTSLKLMLQKMTYWLNFWLWPTS